MIHQRVNCVLCNCIHLEPFYTLEKFPIISSSTDDQITDDIAIDTEFKICKECRCIQLTSLVDKNFLYSHDNTICKRDFWIKHHTSFVSFIENSIPITSICEFGGGSHPLVDYFTQKPSSYSVIDIFKSDIQKEGILYKEGDCESYSKYDEDTIVMSHTFEHLYKPTEFLKNIENSSIKHVFISIPFMESYLKNDSTFVIINTQHTFYYEKSNIEVLFSRYGFMLTHFKEYNDHSLFFGFTKTPTLSRSLPFQPIQSEISMYNHFHKKIKYIQSISINVPFYIMPSLIYGQLVYQYLKDKSYALGILDNNDRVLHKRLYGTPLQIYLPSILQNSSCKDVLLVKTPYYEEMITQLYSLVPDLNIHTLDI